jgi:hypothetical protein
MKKHKTKWGISTGGFIYILLAVCSFIFLTLLITGDLEKWIEFNGSSDKFAFTIFVISTGIVSLFGGISCLQNKNSS